MDDLKSNGYVIVESRVDHQRPGYVGGRVQPGRETPDTRVCIGCVGRSVNGGEEIEVQIWVTIPHLTSIILTYFEEVLKVSPIAKKMLHRLLGKRWALMTSAVYMNPELAGDQWNLLRGQNDSRLK